MKGVLAVIVGTGLALAQHAVHADEAATMAAMTKAGCLACHAKDRKMVGPSFKDIAAKYKGTADVEAAVVLMLKS